MNAATGCVGAFVVAKFSGRVGGRSPVTKIESEAPLLDPDACKTYIALHRRTPMTDVNVTDLRQNLPAYLDRARAESAFV